MKFVEYNNSYLTLLENYFKHPSTPVNNSSHKIFKTHLYNGVDGVMGMLLNNSNEIVAVSSAVVVEEKSVKSCKYPHRLHVRSDFSFMSNKFIDQYWDPFLFHWLEKQNIKNVYCTFNEDNTLAFLWAALRHSRRLKNQISRSEYAHNVLSQDWYIYPKIIKEMNTWQYLIYSSPSNKWFYPHREEKNIDEDVIETLNKRFKFSSDLGWKI